MISLVSKIGALLVLLVIIGSSILIWKKYSENPIVPIACTLEAKICPDGSAVGRVGPNCEFSACPMVDDSDVDVWILSTDVGQGVSFEYPKTIELPFLGVVNWPPEVQIVNSPYICRETVDTAHGATIVEEIINERTYCVTKKSEGAAGSTYISYIYAFPFQNQTARFAFTLKYPQCANYDEPSATECKSQQAELKPLNFIDRMATTLKINR